MAGYEKRCLNGLLDAYENSLLSRGENKVTIRISYPFTKKTMPEYFNESSLAYEDIHACLRELESKGFLTVVWKGNKVNHIVQKVLLREEHVEAVYRHLDRIPKAEKEKSAGRLLEMLAAQYQTPVVLQFISYLLCRIRDGKTVKEYIALEDHPGTELLISAIGRIEDNRTTCYIREFSIRHFSDSKVLEERLGTIGKVFRRFDERFADMDIYGILSEYSIYHTPNYVYLKGEVVLYLDGQDKTGIDLGRLYQGVGISGEDIPRIRLMGNGIVRRVITIENQTVFFRWTEPETIIIYLGGYHNTVRRELLTMLYRQMPEAEYLHFGDIDVGGFEIYEDLCRKTGIPFKTYHMGLEELKKYKTYTKKLTEIDQKRLQVLSEKASAAGSGYQETLEYMKRYGVKLEQECIHD